MDISACILQYLPRDAASPVACCAERLRCWAGHDKAMVMTSSSLYPLQSLGDSHGAGGKAHGGVITAAVAATNVNNARAIENGIMWMTIIPMILKVITYGVRSPYF